LLAFLASMAMSPKPLEYKVFGGDYVTPVSSGDITTNLRGSGSKRFVSLKMNANYEAYDEAYVAARITDPVYSARITDAVLEASSRRTVEEISEGALREVFREELRRAIEPILFPVHIGMSPTPAGSDPLSGIGPGDSIYNSTLRTPLYDGKLFVDAPAGTLRLGDGPEYRITGKEHDLRLEDGRGDYVYLDVTELAPNFRGQVLIGTHGRVRELFFENYTIQ
jgi:hypothetical protein